MTSEAAVSSEVTVPGPAPVYHVIAAVERPCFVVHDRDTMTATNDPSVAASATVLAAVPPLPPARLGDPGFLRDHGVDHPYMAGAMANGIASARLVAAMADAGYLASFGAAGLAPDRVDEALATIARQSPGRSFACNLIHSPSEPALERATVDLCLRHGVRCVEASAFLNLTPQIVRYRVAGLRRGEDGRVVAGNRVIAKLSRAEVAERFLAPPPEPIVRELVGAGYVTAEQAELARSVPMADDLTAEADSGGHTDRRPLAVLVPEMIALRDEVCRERGYPVAVRIGAAGGIGTPAAAAAAFAMGAAYVVTGSINQASVEAAQSDAVKKLLAGAGVADCEMAPSADMFELGVDVQVLLRGTLFASRAKRLFANYRAHASLDDLPDDERADLEANVFRRPLDDVWHDTVRFFSERDPEQIRRAEDNPKRRMALVFRWYLGLSSAWGQSGVADRAVDYQIWCGPAMGACNQWLRGTYLAAPERRGVTELARHMVHGACFASRVAQLRASGVRLAPSCSTYVPTDSDNENR